MPDVASLLAAEKFWILDPLYISLGTLLAWFYSIAHSYGLAIVLLTVVVRLATFPLTAKQARSQQELQRLQPELKRIQAKYKNDRQKLNEEMMKFYKENHVNPFGGCLPVIVQFPVLIVLYRLILGLIDTPPKHIPETSAMYTALVESGGEMVSFGMDLAKKAGEVSGAKQVPFLILIALVMATGYYQQRQMTARLPKESRNSQMVMIGKIFPLMFGLISWTIPAGVVVYFLASNVWQIGQQAFMFRKMPPPPSSEKGAKEEKAKGTKGASAAGGKGGKGKSDPSAKKGVPTPKRTPGSKAAAAGKGGGKGAKGVKGGAKGARGGAKGRGAPAPVGKAPRDPQAAKRAKPVKGPKGAPRDSDGRGGSGNGRGTGKAAAPVAGSATERVEKGTDGSGSAAAGDGNGQAVSGRRRRRGRPRPNNPTPGGNGTTESGGSGAPGSGPASVADTPKKKDDE